LRSGLGRKAVSVSKMNRNETEHSTRCFAPLTCDAPRVISVIKLESNVGGPPSCEGGVQRCGLSDRSRFLTARLWPGQRLRSGSRQEAVRQHGCLVERGSPGNSGLTNLKSIIWALIVQTRVAAPLPRRVPARSVGKCPRPLSSAASALAERDMRARTLRWRSSR
jgi:hypothetical protein